jgi:hypothetical protein
MSSEVSSPSARGMFVTLLIANAVPQAVPSANFLYHLVLSQVRYMPQ